MHGRSTRVCAKIFAKGANDHATMLAPLIIFIRQKPSVLQDWRKRRKEGTRLFAWQSDPDKGAEWHENGGRCI